MESKSTLAWTCIRPAFRLRLGDDAGKLVMESVIETKAGTILEFIRGLRGSTSAAWLYDLLKPHVAS